MFDQPKTWRVLFWGHSLLFMFFHCGIMWILFIRFFLFHTWPINVFQVFSQAFWPQGSVFPEFVKLLTVFDFISITIIPMSFSFFCFFFLDEEYFNKFCWKKSWQACPQMFLRIFIPAKDPIRAPFMPLPKKSLTISLPLSDRWNLQAKPQKREPSLNIRWKARETAFSEHDRWWSMSTSKSLANISIMKAESA